MIDQSLKTASVVATAEGKVTDERSDNRTYPRTKLRERYYVINLLYHSIFCLFKKKLIYGVSLA